MYRILIAAALAATATTAFAADAVVEPVATVAPHVSGYGQLYVGGLWLSEGGDDESATSGGGVARINVPINDRWNIQGDFGVDSLWESGENIYNYGGGAHVYWRDPGSYALGGFATITGYGGDDGLDALGLYSFTIGPEAQAYFGNVTLYGQAYYGQIRADDFGGDHFDNWGARAVVRYFAQDNLRFDAELGYNRLSAGGEHLDTFSPALQAMYRFSGTPLSVFGRYQLDHISAGGSDANIHKFVVGLRASFGSSSLLDEDRNGATMDTYTPNFVVPLF